MKKAEKADATREAIFEAATKVVGRYGYAGASIGKITSAANVAQGTFYYHFKSQAELFDLLLPTLGEDLLRRIREATVGVTGVIERQEVGFRTFFNFMLEKPDFYRILTEAEVFAPHAYATHMRNVLGRYLRALTRSWDKGELRGFEKHELEMITSMLAGAMSYLTLRYTAEHKSALQVPEPVVRAYVKFVAQAFGIADWERRLATAPKAGKRAKVNAARAGGKGPIPLRPEASRRSNGEDGQLGRRELGRAGALFGPDGLDFLAIFVRCCKELLLTRIGPAHDVWLRSFSQEIVSLPGNNDDLVVHVSLQPIAQDLVATTMLVEIAGSERIVVAVVSGVFGLRGPSQPMSLDGVASRGDVLAQETTRLPA